MENIKRLNSARAHIHNGRMEKAVQECLELIEQGSAEASDYLGVLYCSGFGVPKDMQEAEKYFLLAHNRGYAMGTYHLAGEYRRKSKISEAVELSKSIAEVNPSAAYWAFRGLRELSRDQKSLEIDAEKYLLLAANMGHIEALLTIAKRTMKGYYGIKKIPHGIKKTFQVISGSRGTIKKRERLKYIDSLHRRGFKQFEKMIKEQQ